MKKCSKCQKTKPLSEFHKNRVVKKDGLSSLCKSCMADINLLRNYGISLEDYDKMYESQGGKCAICGRPERVRHLGSIKRLAVDHNHDTGKVRSLLCSKCNSGLGSFKDNQTNLLNAMKYLKEGRQCQIIRRSVLVARRSSPCQSSPRTRGRMTDLLSNVRVALI